MNDRPPLILAEQIEVVPLEKLSPHPSNPREGNVGAIIESIRHNGFYSPLIVQRSTGFVLAGNHRYYALEILRSPAAPVVYIDVDDDQARRILLMDNKASDEGTYDDAALAALLQELQDGSGTLMGTGYTGDDLDDLLRDLNGPAQPSGTGTDEDSPTPPAPSAPPAPEGSALREFTVRLNDGEFDTVQAAMRRAKKKYGVLEDDLALASLCREYLDRSDLP